MYIVRRVCGVRRRVYGGVRRRRVYGVCGVRRRVCVRCAPPVCFRFHFIFQYVEPIYFESVVASGGSGVSGERGVA